MDELLTFYGILIASGYSSVPRRHMYWSVDNDVHNESISGAMRRNRFDDIMASVHVVDNTKITDDPFFKFIKGKPIRFGYKVWSLASSSGYMYHMEPYCGSLTLLPETGLGQGPSIIIGLAEQAQVPQGCKFFHDNLFTTISLMDEMTKRGYRSSGTMRQNRLFDVPFTPLNAFMKLPRGTSEVLCQGEKLLVRWKDNNIVTVATNMDEKYTESSVKRWNRHRSAFDNVQQPKCISRYNEHMGGVDLHDLQVSRYHISIFAWSINSALVNGHLFYRDVIGGTIDLLTFSRIVSESLLQRTYSMYWGRFAAKCKADGMRISTFQQVLSQVEEFGAHQQVEDSSPYPVPARPKEIQDRNSKIYPGMSLCQSVEMTRTIPLYGN
eukprot:XP_011617051.1 PREDICTED: piggyBac transposable element-derived protein 3-like [Takifugu rubripes]